MYRPPQPLLAVNNDNFVRSNLKKRGNAGGYTARKRKQAKFDARAASREQDGCSGGGPHYGSDGSSDGSSDDDDKVTVARQRRESGGLAALGLDALELCLEAISAPARKGAPATKRATASNSSSAGSAVLQQQLARGLAPKRSRAKRGAHQLFTDDDLAEHAPCCSGHAFPAKVRPCLHFPPYSLDYACISHYLCLLPFFVGGQSKEGRIEQG